MLRIQWVHEPCPPWNRTTGRPDPHWRHTMQPFPHGVEKDVERASSATTSSDGGWLCTSKRGSCRYLLQSVRSGERVGSMAAPLRFGGGLRGGSTRIIRQSP